MASNNAAALRLVLQHFQARGIAADARWFPRGMPSRLLAADHARTLAVLLEHGANPHRYYDVSDPIALGVSTVSTTRACLAGAAVAFGLPQHLRLLLAAGLDPNAPATLPTPAQPLLVASIQGYGFALTKSDADAAARALRCIDLLLAAGADPYLRDSTGIDAFFMAARHGGVQVLRKVLVAGGLPGTATTSRVADTAATDTLAAAAGEPTAAARMRSEALARRLSDPIPGVVTYRMPRADVWSAETAHIRETQVPTQR